VIRRAESALVRFVKAKAPTVLAAALIAGSPPHPLFDAITVDPLNTLITGSSITGRIEGMLNELKIGPEARIRTVLEVAPLIVNPEVNIAPAFTRCKQDKFTRRGVVAL
jgi:hypothetical protein